LQLDIQIDKAVEYRESIKNKQNIMWENWDMQKTIPISLV